MLGGGIVQGLRKSILASYPQIPPAEFDRVLGVLLERDVLRGYDPLLVNPDLAAKLR